ncbi:MAG: hypothetical protein J5702_03355 [Bacteroidales bacterium]|nr:hypothetical protein [Bacteroidales bacterium]
MRRFLIKTSLLLLPVLVFVVLCETGHRTADNDYKYKYRWLSEHASRVKILSLGSSHGYQGIEPDQFDDLTFNAAHVSQDLHYDEFIFNSFVDRMDSLKCLILPISYFSPWSRLEDGLEAWRVRRYHLYYHYPTSWFDPQYNLEIYSGLRPRTALREILGKSNNLYVTELGRGTRYNKKNRSDNWKDTGILAAERHTRDNPDTNLYQANLLRVRRMIEKCREKHADVLLITMPAYITYRENLKEDQLSKAISFCLSLKEEYDNVYYLDMLADPRFTEDDFYDSDHLNEYGAAKLSYILNRAIKERQMD